MDGVLSVGKAFTILNCISEAGGVLSLNEISARTGMPKSTVHNLLSTMRLYRAISQDDNGKYRLGSLLFELGSSVERQWDITLVAKPHLQAVSTAVGESTCVAVLDGTSMLVLDTSMCAGSMRVMIEVGARLPLHASSLGKAVLSGRPDARELLTRNMLTSYTPHTACNADQLLAQLDKIRADGFAIEDGEMRIGMRSVAVPIKETSGRVRYAIGVTGMFRRTTDPTFIQAEKLLMRAASDISAALSGRL